MRQAHPQCFADDLGSRRGSEELTAAAGSGTGATAHVGGILQTDFSVCEARADSLDFPGIFAGCRRQRHTARDEDARQFLHGGECHHHRGQAFIARGNPDDTFSRRQGADESAENLRRIVAVSEAIHHPDGALRSAITRIGAVAGERDSVKFLQLMRHRLHEESYLPMPGVITERDGTAIGRTDTALRAEDEELLAAKFCRCPAHGGVVAQPKDVATWPSQEHLFGEREAPFGASRVRLDVIDVGGAALKDVGVVNRFCHTFYSSPPTQ